MWWWSWSVIVIKAKASDYIAHLTGTKPDRPRFTIIGSGSWSARVNAATALMRPSIAHANEQLDPRQQLANTPPPQSTTPGLHTVSIHQMAPPKRTSNCQLRDMKCAAVGGCGCTGVGADGGEMCIICRGRQQVSIQHTTQSVWMCCFRTSAWRYDIPRGYCISAS